MSTLAERLREVRTDSGLSQKEFADLIGTRNTTVCKWESGASSPRPDTISQIALVAGVMYPWLLLGEGPKTKAEVEQKKETELRKNEIAYTAKDARQLDAINLVIRNIRRIPGITEPEQKMIHQALSEIRTSIEARMFL